ncbi:NAD(P)-dependent oxidoreductase, partial [Clostridium perfringens]
MNVQGTSRRTGSLPAGVTEVALGDLFASSDAVVVCCALTDATRGLVSRDLIAAMPAHAVIVNVSRGAVIDTPALIEALRARLIA